MGKLRKRTYIAGPLVYEALYPIPNPRDSETVRRGKQEATKAAQEYMNLRNLWLKLELLLAANFRQNDLVLTLTFRDDTLPENRSGVQRKLKEFFKGIRNIRAPWGVPVMYVYRIEHWHSREFDGMTELEKAKQGRWHVHMVLNSTGHDLDDVKKCWPYGLLEIQPLRVDREKNYESLARYFTKEPRDKLGHRAFTASLNLRKPEIDTVIVPSHEQLKPPRDSEVYANSGEIQTVYGKHQFVKYLWPKLVEQAPKAKRKKHKKAG